MTRSEPERECAVDPREVNSARQDVPAAETARTRCRRESDDHGVELGVGVSAG